MTMTLSLTGQLVRKQTYGDWAVGLFRAQDGSTTKIVGPLVAGLQDGHDYQLTGEVKKHPKYGEQLDVAGAVPHVEPSRLALLKHLERNFKGVGPKTAERIVAHFEEADGGLGALRDILVNRPWELQSFSTTGGSRRPIQFRDADGAGAQSYLYRLLATQHLGIGVPDSVLRRLTKWLLERLDGHPDPVGQAIDWFRKDPYRPIVHVWGYGFGYADAVGKSLGIPADAPARIAALAYHTLKTAIEGDGHTFLPRAVFEERVRSVDPSFPFDLAIAYAAQREFPIASDPQGRYYPDDLMDIEDRVAALIRPMIRPAPALRAFAGREAVLAELRRAEGRVREGFRLDESQRNAVIGLLSAQRRLHTLTAGPGCGKTSIMEVFAQLALGTVAFCAPTGKAARVLHARVHRHGFSATTIHQLLEPSPFGFQRNQDNPIDADIVVVDESSMVDLQLCLSLLLALRPTAHLVLVGDRDQLPSVGPGNVLANVLELPADHHTLTVTHRNAGAILALVQAVRQGQFVSPGAELTGDVLHFPVVNTDAGTFDLVETTYLDAVGRVGLQQTGLLVARRKGRRDTPGWNTTYLNARLQAIVNPHGPAIPGTPFRIGDRVIIRRNMVVPQPDDSTIPVVNGDTGQIAAVDRDQEHEERVKTFTLALDDGRRVVMSAELLDVVSLAYALTVHAAQGSEYRVAIVVITNGSPSFMHRKVLYTAVSRARESLVLFGENATLAAIARRRGGARYSALVPKSLKSSQE